MARDNIVINLLDFNAEPAMVFRGNDCYQMERIFQDRSGADCYFKPLSRMYVRVCVKYTINMYSLLIGVC